MVRRHFLRSVENECRRTGPSSPTTRVSTGGPSVTKVRTRTLFISRTTFHTPSPTCLFITSGSGFQRQPPKTTVTNPSDPETLRKYYSSDSV